MAILDEKRDTLVIRIVYDGPAFSGKTTSIRALSGGLEHDVRTPREHDGRTLYFDWFDYTAGRFQGRSIRCQVITVPGQKSLATRRRQLLETADSVIFVADTTSLGLELSLKYARDLNKLIAKAEEPHPGVVIQANKRDLDDALPVPELLQAFRGIGLEAAIAESTATTGEGIKAAFLLGVRLALDRVRSLMETGQLKSGRPEIDSSEELLERLRETDSSESPAASASPSKRGDASVAPASNRGDASVDFRAGQSETSAGQGDRPEAGQNKASMTGVIKEALRAEDDENRLAPTATTRDDLPNPEVPSGYIWPPVKGRVIVQQALADQQPATERLDNGDYLAKSANGWVIHSHVGNVYRTHADARGALVEWARLHVRNEHLVSPRRCIVLSPQGAEWRLWQMVGYERSLQVFMDIDYASVSSRAAAECLAVCSTKLIKAMTAFPAGTIDLPVEMTSIAADTAEPVYLGLMPSIDGDEFVQPGARDGGTQRAATLMKRHVKAATAVFGSVELRSELKRIGLETAVHDAAIGMLTGLIDLSRAA